MTARYPDEGLFLCFEGGEGSGKTTQARLLAGAIRDAGYTPLLTHEPGGTEVGQKLRGILLSPETGDLAPKAEALLYAADKSHHLREVVLPALAQGEVVVTDRYVDSTLAYQGAGRTLDTAGLEDMIRWATDDLRPHLTIVLDVPPEVGLSRFASRDRIEGEGLEFHSRVRATFLALAAADPEHYLVLDATGDKAEIAAAIARRVEPLLAHALRTVAS